MKKIIPLILLASFALTACGRENPLAKDIERTAQWAFQKRTPAIEACGKTWADQTTAKAEDLKACEAVAEQLAKLFTEGGFGEVTPEDVPLPQLWIAFNEYVRAKKANTYDKDEAKKAFGEKW